MKSHSMLTTYLKNRIDPKSGVFKFIRSLFLSIGITPENFRLLRLLKVKIVVKKYAFNPEHEWIYNVWVKKGSVVIDVGACTGEYIDQALKRGAAMVKAFDPSPRCYEYLIKKYYKNRRVKIYPFGLSASFDHFRFFVNETIGQDSYKHATVSHKSILSFVGRLDCVTRSRVDFIKIDAEGLDYRVLLGAEDLIEKFRPAILCEYSEANHKKMLNYMHSFNYSHDFIYDQNTKVTDIIFIPSRCVNTK
jgi:FkbM family methyltransferase